MKKGLVLVALVLGLAATLTGCVPTVEALIGPQQAAPVEHAAPEQADALSPEEVVTRFYQGYIEAATPLRERAYAESPYLSEGFVEKVDEIIASFDGGGYDPILIAQDIPTSFRLGDVVVDGDEATVPVYTSFFGHELTVRLERIDGDWLIADVTRGMVDTAEMGPQEVAEWFYDAYLNYPQNPLVTRAFLSRATMTERFWNHVSDTLDSFAEQEAGGYDPILMAQDVPEVVTITDTVVEGDRATLTAETSFAGHRLRIEMLQEDGRWKFDSIQRAGD